jgi:superfamily II DNA helicase RecQ
MQGFLRSLTASYHVFVLPVSRQHLEQSPGEVVQSTEFRIQEFLTQNRHSAYTPLEILQGIYPGTVVDPINDPRQFFVEAALDSLLSKKAVVGKMITEAGRSILYFVCS